MDRRSKILIIALAIALTASVALTFWRTMLSKNFEVVFSEEPASEE